MPSHRTRGLLLLFFLLTLTASAYDFTSGGMAFTITNAAQREVTLEYDPMHPYTGDFVIPATVQNAAGTSYKVVGTGMMCFYAGTITSITFGENQREIGNNSFYGCALLSEVNIPDRITKLGGSAFMYCSALVDARLSRSLTSLPEYAFNSCTNLSGLRIPDGVKDVAYASLAYCEALDSVVIGKGVESIGKQAFFKSSLKRLIVRAAVPPTVAADAFTDEMLASTLVEVPKESLEAYRQAEVWKNFALLQAGDDALFTGDDRTEEKDNPKDEPQALRYRIISLEERTCAVMPGVDGEITAENPGVYSGDIVIPETIELTTSSTSEGEGEGGPFTVVAIDPHAFNRCYDLRSLVMPNTITTIGESAFYGCYRSATEGLTRIRMSDNLQYSGSYAFYGCGALQQVEIGNLANWCRITFEDARANPLPWAHHLVINGEERETLEIPAGVEEIRPYTFYNLLGVKRLVVPAGVKSIGQSAFCFADDLEEVVLGPDVEYLHYAAFLMCPHITHVTCQGTTPPGAEQWFNYEFDYDITQTATLHIPEGTAAAYAAANLWQCFTNVKEDIPSRIALISSHSSAGPVYNLEGRRLSPAQQSKCSTSRGLYLQRGRKIVKIIR